MARRKAKPQQQGQEQQELCGPQAGRLPQQWSEIDPAELEHRHQQAALLVARGYGAVRLRGTSTGSLFDDLQPTTGGWQSSSAGGGWVAKCSEERNGNPW